MATISSYRDLLVWQKAIALVTACYRLTASFPSDERFGLTSQLRRAAVSIPANIAEGQARGTPKAFAQFLWIANSSRAEVETHIVIAEQVGFVTRADTEPVFEMLSEIGRMLTGLRRSLDEARTEHRPTT